MKDKIESRKFDAVFVGLDPGALVLAARLIREKKTVAIIDIESLPPADSSYFPIEPTLLRELFQFPDLILNPLKVVLALPGERRYYSESHFDEAARSTSGVSGTLSEVFKLPKEKISKVAQATCERFLKSWKRNKGLFAKVPPSEQQALSWALFEVLPEHLSPDQALLNSFQTETSVKFNGLRNFLGEVESKLEKGGLQVIRTKGLPKFHFRKNELESLTVASSNPEGASATVSGVWFVLSESVQCLRQQSIGYGPWRFWRRLPKAPKVDGIFVNLTLQCGERGLPQDIPNHVVIYSPDEPPIDVKISLQTEGPRIYHQVRARAAISLLEGVRTPSRLKKIQFRMLRVLTETFPYLENHIENFTMTEIPAEAQLVSSLPLAQKLLSGVGIGVGKKFSRLKLISRESYPQFGHFGSWIAAVQVWSQMCQFYVREDEAEKRKVIRDKKKAQMMEKKRLKMASRK